MISFVVRRGSAVLVFFFLVGIYLSAFSFLVVSYFVFLLSSPISVECFLGSGFHGAQGGLGVVAFPCRFDTPRVAFAFRVCIVMVSGNNGGQVWSPVSHWSSRKGGPPRFWRMPNICNTLVGWSHVEEFSFSLFH